MEINHKRDNYRIRGWNQELQHLSNGYARKRDTESHGEGISKEIIQERLYHMSPQTERAPKCQYKEEKDLH